MRCFIRQWDTRFYSGEVVRRDLNLHHDLLEDARVELTWTLTQADTVLDTRTIETDMAAGALHRHEIDLPMPKVDSPTPVVLTTVVTRNGEEAFREQHHYTVYPRRKLRVPEGLKLAVLDRPGRSVDALRKAGLPFVHLGMLETFNKGMMDFGQLSSTDNTQTEGLNAVIVAVDGFDPVRLQEFVDTVTPFMQSGRTVICLRQTNPGTYMNGWADVGQMRYGRDTTISWRRRPDHPLLDGITDDMLRYWRGNHVVSTGDFLKPAAAGFSPIVDSADELGLRWTSLCEKAFGKGRLVLCQMRLVEKLGTEPAAQILLENMLAYATQPKAEAATDGVTVIPAESEAARMIRSLGFGAGQRVTVVKASAELDEAAINDLAKRVSAGHVVLLHALTPENLPRWQALLPPETKLSEVNGMHALKANDHPVLSGLSATELWWSAFPPWDRAERGPAAVEFAADGGEGAVTLAEPGAVTVWKMGKGMVVIDQLLWDSPKVHRRRANRYLAGLLNNLMKLSDE